MKKKSLNIHKRDNQSFRHRLLLSIFRIAAPVTAIVCTVSIVMLTLNYRQTVINSQAAAGGKCHQTRYDLCLLYTSPSPRDA